MNQILNLSVQQLQAAVKIKGQIASLEGKLAKILGADTTSRADAPKKRRRMSKAARARIAASARARWRRAKAAGKNRL